MNQRVKIVKGAKGWGGPLVLEKTQEKNIVASITGGGIHPVAQRIGEVLGAEVVDGFKNKVEPENMICAVIDCGGTARCGVYPRLGVPTVDVMAASPSGPLHQFIKDHNFVSDVSVNDILSTDEQSSYPKVDVPKHTVESAKSEVAAQGGFFGLITSMGRVIGKFVNTFYQGGRDAIETIIKNILPFMAFVSVIVGFIMYTDIGNMLANLVKPLAGNIVGLLILSFICAIPILSPVLGPGAVIAQVVGVLLGVEIARGNIPPSLALPALFAINSQVGCDFIPVGLTLAESKPYTVEVGVPALLFTRMVTGPISVLIAYLFSFNLY